MHTHPGGSDERPLARTPADVRLIPLPAHKPHIRSEILKHMHTRGDT